MSLKGNTIEQEQDLANLEQVKKCYELGQKAYQEKDYRNAVHNYHRCILHAKAIAQLTAPEIKEKAQELMNKSYNNLVACLLARDSNDKEDYMRAVSYCDNVLKSDPKNEEALFSKGVALMRAGNWEQAVEQFEQCKNNAQAKQHISECKRIIDEDRRRQDAGGRPDLMKEFTEAMKRCDKESAQMMRMFFDARKPRNAQQMAVANGNPPAAYNTNSSTMNDHVQHQ